MADLTDNNQPEAGDDSVVLQPETFNLMGEQPVVAADPMAVAEPMAVADPMAAEQPMAVAEPMAAPAAPTESYDLKVADLDINDSEMQKPHTGFSKRMWLIIAGVVGLLAVIVFLAFSFFTDTGLFKGVVTNINSNSPTYVKMTFANGKETMRIDEGTQDLSINFALHQFTANMQVLVSFIVTNNTCETAYDEALIIGPRVTRPDIDECKNMPVRLDKTISIDANGDFTSNDPIIFPIGNAVPGDYFLVAQIDASNLANQTLNKLQVLPGTLPKEAIVVAPTDPTINRPITDKLKSGKEPICSAEKISEYQQVVNLIDAITTQKNNTSGIGHTFLADINQQIDTVYNEATAKEFQLTNDNYNDSQFLGQLLISLNNQQITLGAENQECAAAYGAIVVVDTAPQQDLQALIQTPSNPTPDTDTSIAQIFERRNPIVGNTVKANILFDPVTKVQNLNYFDESKKLLIKTIRFTIVAAPPAEVQTPVLTIDKTVLSETTANGGTMEVLTVTVANDRFRSESSPQDSFFTFTIDDVETVIPFTFELSDANHLAFTFKPENHEAADNVNKIKIHAKTAAFGQYTDTADIISPEFAFNFTDPPDSQNEGFSADQVTNDISLDLARDTFDNTHTDEISVIYDIDMGYPDAAKAKVDLCLFANSDNTETFFRDGPTATTFCLERAKEITFTDTVHHDASLKLNGHIDNDTTKNKLVNGDYTLALRVHDVVDAADSSVSSQSFPATDSFTVNFTDAQVPQPTITLDVNPATITTTDDPSVATYEFDVKNPAATRATVDLFLYKDNAAQSLLYVQTDKVLELTEGRYTIIGDNTNTDSMRYLYGTDDNTRLGDKLVNGTYKLRLVVKKVDNVAITPVLFDDASVAIDFDSTPPENTVPTPPENTVPQDPITVVEPPVITIPTTTVVQNEQVVTTTTTPAPRETRPSGPDAQANLIGAPTVQGETGPGMLLYPFMAGGSYLLARRRRRKQR